MKEFEEAGLIHIPADSEKSLKPQKMERYLEICLNLQSSHCSKFRHFLFLTGKFFKNVLKPVVQDFLKRLNEMFKKKLLGVKIH